MVYASAKAGLIRAAQDELGFEIAKKVSCFISYCGWRLEFNMLIWTMLQLEVSNADEITAPTIEEEFRPKLVEKQGFARPKRPGRRWWYCISGRATVTYLFLDDEYESDRMTKRGSSLAIFTCEKFPCVHLCRDDEDKFRGTCHVLVSIQSNSNSG